MCVCKQVYGLSGPVARYIGRNGPILHRFANEDVTLGAWLVGLEVTHVDERRFCCDSAERCMAQVRCPFCLYDWGKCFSNSSGLWSLGGVKPGSGPSQGHFLCLLALVYTGFEARKFRVFG